MGDILASRDGPVLLLRMNRAAKKNALTGAMYSALTEGLASANADDGVGAVVLLGQPGIFCAGNDIQDFIAFASGGGIGEPVLAFLRALVANEKPLLAAIDGAAIGIGTTMILHCDYAIASTRAAFSTPFVDLGLVPEAASSLIVPQLMGNRLAFEMLAMGAKFPAERAREIGLVNRVAEPETIETEIFETAQAIAAKPREAVKLARRLIRGDQSGILARIDEEAKLFSERLRSGEARQAFATFLSRGKI